MMSAADEDTCVDDIITGKDEESDAIDLVKDVSETLLKGGFKLAPWPTNSRKVLQKLPHEFRCQENISLFPEQHVEWALGVFWISSKDMLTYRGKRIDVPSTKRAVMSTVMSVYDPLGFLSGWMLNPRVLMQELWRRQLDWDDTIPDDLQVI